MKEMEKKMPVLSSDLRRYPDCPKDVPMELFNEEMAQQNHGQSLERLRERGGLGVCEMILNIKKLPLKHIWEFSDLECIAELKKLLTA